MNRKSWWLRYFTSYLIIGVFPVIIFGTIFYYINVISLNKEIKNSNFSALTQSLNKIDFLIGKMSNIAYHLSNNQIIDRNNSIVNNDFSVVDGNNMIQRLNSYENTIDVPIQMMLYLRGDDSVYLSDGKYSYSIFEEQMTDIGNLTMSSFFTMINSSSYNNSLKLKKNFTDKSSKNLLSVFLYPIPYMDMMPYATLGFMLADKDMNNIFENYLGDIKGNIYVYNEYLQEIYSSEKVDFLEGTSNDYVNMKGTGVFEMSIQGVPCILMRAVSENSGFSFIVVMEEKGFYGRVNLMQNVLLVSSVLLFLIGILLALLMAVKNYRPIKRLLLNINEGDSKNPDNRRNEFELIQGKWDDILDKNNKLNIMINRQRPMVMNACLSNLLKGKLINREELDFALKCANINLSSQYAFVMLIAPQKSQMLGEQMQEILAFTGEVIYPMARMYGLELILEKKVAVVVNCDISEINQEDIRIQLAHMVQKNISENFHIEVKIGIGGIYQNITNINTSFMEATVVVSDYMSVLHKDVAVFEEAAASECENYTYPVIEQAMYIHSLKRADKVVALKSLETMHEKIILNSGSYSITQCLCYDIINMMIKTVSQINCELKGNDIKNLCTFTNVEEFIKHARAITIQICDQHELAKEERNSRMKTDLIDFVNSNFKDPDMSLESIADRFDISSNYLSHFFKYETGCNFIQYVTMLRMDWIKNQLIQTDKQIKDIVTEAGYMNVASFVRKFRSYEGITPGQYREQMRIVG